MARAFWTIRPAVTKPDGERGPSWPVPDGLLHYTVPGDINVLTGSAQPHRHLLAGAVALPSAQVTGQYALHYHYVVNGVQVTVGAPAHTHDDAQVQDGFLVFAACSDAVYDSLIAGGVRPIVHCPVTVENGEARIGPMDTDVWSAQELSYFKTAAVNALGLALPAEVDRGKRLVMFLLGLLQARRPGGDEGYRLTSYREE